MKRKFSKRVMGIALVGLLCFNIASTSVFAGNREFGFSLTGTTSEKATGGSEAKDDDSKIAYVTPKTRTHSVATNFRVRNTSGGEATYLLELQGSELLGRHTLNYKAYEGGKGNRFNLYANLKTKPSSTVKITGTWCP